MSDKPSKSIFEIASLVAIGLAVLSVTLVVYETNKFSTGIDEINKHITALEQRAGTTEQESKEQSSASVLSDSNETPMKIYLADYDSEESTQCSYEMVPVRVDLERQTGIELATLQLLLDSGEENYGESGLYNALYQSDLVQNGGEWTESKLRVDFQGDLIFDNACQAAIIKEELEQTLLQSSYVNEVEITINGKKLEDVLSGKESGLFLDD